MLLPDLTLLHASLTTPHPHTDRLSQPVTRYIKVSLALLEPVKP